MAHGRVAADSAELALHAVPRGIDAAGVRDWLIRQRGIGEVHDLHIWAMSTRERRSQLTWSCQAVTQAMIIYSKLGRTLEQKFGICHVTLQTETGSGTVPCALASEHVVLGVRAGRWWHRLAILRSSQGNIRYSDECSHNVQRSGPQ